MSQNNQRKAKEPTKKVKDTVGGNFRGSAGSRYRQQYAGQVTTASLQENQKAFQEIFAPDKNYDIIERQLEIGGRPAVMYMIDGFTDAGSLQRMIQFFTVSNRRECQGMANVSWSRCCPTER